MELSKIIRTQKDEGKDKHVPTLVIDKGHKEGRDIVRVVVGHECRTPTRRSITSPGSSSTASRRMGGRSSTLVERPGLLCTSNPNVRFQINQIDELKTFYALAYCNIHGLWGSSLDR